MLDILKQKNAIATFFMIGENAASYPDLVREVVADGNEIGNHSYTHPNLANASPRKTMIELSGTKPEDLDSGLGDPSTRV